jgi:hypothetical protein
VGYLEDAQKTQNASVKDVKLVEAVYLTSEIRILGRCLEVLPKSYLCLSSGTARGKNRLSFFCAFHVLQITLTFI